MIYCPNNLQIGEISQAALDLLKLASAELPLKKAAAIAAEHYGLKKKALYEAGLKFKSEQD
jgi:16S rRNA (cytidine1402-2'-O)-methyltransferase